MTPRRVALAALVGVAAFWSAPAAGALPPAPFCPGTGVDVDVLGAGGGYCDFLYTPDGIHVHCEWGGFAPGLISIAGGSNCWRVYPDGSRVPPEPAPQR